MLVKKLLKEELENVIYVLKKIMICLMCIVFWLEKTTQLKWIQLESVGFGEYQNLKNGEGFIMTNLKGFFSVPVAETVLAGILGFYRGVDRLTLHKHQKKWVGSAIRSELQLLQGSKVLIAGGGNIGKQIAKLLSAFEVQTIVFDTFIPDPDISSLSELDSILPQVDIVVSSLPETKNTIGLFSEARLNKMKGSALFVNVGRGAVVDEQALINLLLKEKIGGCVLDVSHREPLPSDNPLWSCPNTILTQHSGGGWTGEQDGRIMFFLDNLQRFNQGKALLNVVDIEKGF